MNSTRQYFIDKEEEISNTYMNASGRLANPNIALCKKEFQDLWSTQSTSYLRSMTSEQYMDTQVSNHSIEKCVKRKDKQREYLKKRKNQRANRCIDEVSPCLVPPCQSFEVCYDKFGNPIKRQNLIVSPPEHTHNPLPGKDTIIYVNEPTKIQNVLRSDAFLGGVIGVILSLGVVYIIKNNK